MSNRFDFLELEPAGRLPRARPAPVTPAAPAEPTPPAPAVEAPWGIVEVIGGPGTAAGEFAAPTGLAVDANGTLFVADSYNHRIQRISPAGDVFTIGRRGSRPGEFLNPQAVAVAPARDVRPSSRFYVLEQGNHRIQVFEPDGTPVSIWGGPGIAPSQFSAPTGIAVDPAGNLYVADTGNDRVVRWNASGQPTAVLDAATIGGGVLGKPRGLCVDRAGRLYVTDSFQHQVLVFDAGLRLLGRIGAFGSDAGELAEPVGVGVDAEAGNHRVQIFDSADRSLQRIDHAAKLGRFQSPASVAVTRDGSIYVADGGSHRIFRLAR